MLAIEKKDYRMFYTCNGNTFLQNDIMICANLVEISIEDIIFSNEASSIMMKNNANGKNFLIHVSIETGSLLLDLFQKRSPKRPDTFTLLSNCVTSLGAYIQAVTIYDMCEGIFLAKIILNNKGTLSSLDARPSDAIALALVNNLPILATETLTKKLSWINPLKRNANMPPIFFHSR